VTRIYQRADACATCQYEVEYDDAHPWPGGGWLCGKPAIRLPGQTVALCSLHQRRREP
jgi:hypothetical protein